MTAANIPEPFRALRILHVFSFFRPDFTGEGIYLERLQHVMRCHGVEGDVVVQFTAAPAVAGADQPFGRIVRLGGRDDIFGLAPLWSWLLANADRYHLVHFHSIVDRTFTAHLLCRARGLPVVLSCTLDDSAGRQLETYRPLYRPIVARLMRTISRFIAISPWLYEDCLRVMPAERVVLVPQGARVAAPTATRAQYRAALGCRPDEIVALFVGGLCARKGIDTLVEVLPEVARAAPGARLHLVGPELEPAFVDRLRQRAVELGVAARLVMHGPMADPVPFYRAADMLLFASHREGFGNVLLEAMATGLPVVARRLSGVTDYFIEHAVTGFLWTDPADIAGHVGRLAADPALRARIGAAAAAKVAADFDLNAIALRYVREYGALVGGRTTAAERLARRAAIAP